MGRVIRTQRKGGSIIFQSKTRLKKHPAKHRVLDYAERNGYVKGVVRNITHESGRGACVLRAPFIFARCWFTRALRDYTAPLR